MTTSPAQTCPHCNVAYEALSDGSMPRFCPRCGGALPDAGAAAIDAAPRCSNCGEIVGVAMDEGARCGSCGQLIVQTS